MSRELFYGTLELTVHKFIGLIQIPLTGLVLRLSFHHLERLCLVEHKVSIYIAIILMHELPYCSIYYTID